MTTRPRPTEQAHLSAPLVAGELATNGLASALQTDRVLRHGKDAVHEAVTLHGVHDSVLPSIDASIRDMETTGIERMQELQKRSARHAAQAVPPAKDPTAFVQRMLESAHSGNWAAFRNDTQTLAAMHPGRDMHAQAVANVDVQQQRAAHQQSCQQAADQQQAMQQVAVPGMRR